MDPIGADPDHEPSDPAVPRAVRVLVVDDESAIRTALRRLFARLGWQVDDAPHGAAALDLIATTGYALVVSDLRMPVLSGIELHDALARTRPDLLARTIFCTGDVVSHEVAEFIATTARPVLQKPFDLGELRRLAEDIVGGAGTPLPPPHAG